MLPDVSIYIPAYNAEKTIKQCIDSILLQSIKPAKILVINDCSTDSTNEILIKYNKSIEIINNKENMGVSYCRNLALQYLKSKFVASIDADVEISKNWIELLINKSNEKKITLIGGKMYEKYTSNPFNYWRSIRLKQNWGENDISNPNFVFGCNNILNTENINLKENYRNDNNYFRTNGEDIEFSNYLKNNNFNLYYSSEAICYHLQDDDSLSLSKRYWRYIHYGDGLKKRNFIKTLKNIFRQVKKTFKWSLSDIFSLNFKLILINFILLYHFIILDLKFYRENKL